MANTYTFYGPGERWSAEEATAEDKMNVARENADHLHEALNTIMDTDAAGGVVDGILQGLIQITAAWDDPVLFGTVRLWDDSGTLRMKSGADPGSATDGDVIAVVVAGTYDDPVLVGDVRLWSNGSELFAKLGAAPSTISDGYRVNVGPITMHHHTIDADMTIGADYNAISAGPLTIDATVTVEEGATWAIV